MARDSTTINTTLHLFEISYIMW